MLTTHLKRGQLSTEMFVLKRKSIVIVTAFIMIGATFILCVFSLKNTQKTVASGIRVVLDAGHGGIDNGVSGILSGQKESEINLDVVKRTERYLISAGIGVVLTRSSDAGLYGVASVSLKKRDMLKRKEIIQNANPTLVVSVHMNYYPNSTRRGGQVFFRKDSERGKVLAERLQSSLNELYAEVKDYSPLSGDYYILNCSEYPSVIAECGFLSNPKDDELLKTEEFRDKVAYALFKGIVEYLSVNSISYFNASGG